jgi:hypothetical protein
VALRNPTTGDHSRKGIEDDMDFEDDIEDTEDFAAGVEDEARNAKPNSVKRASVAGRLIEQAREKRELEKALADFDDYVI